MRRTAERAVALLTIALTAAVTPAAGATLWDTPTGASAANGPAVISYYEEIPCPPTAGDPGRRRSIRKRVHRKRPHVIKAKAAVPRPVVKPVAPVRPVVHRVVHRRPKRALPRVTRIAALTLPKRCTVLHRDRLTFASLVLAPREASDFSPSPDPVGVAVGPQVLAPLVTGGAPFAPHADAGQRRRRSGHDGHAGERRP